ncbi:hypothetical protein J7438_10925 [Thalassotalea sp. G20_0]|uniref:hypothetical protein n=1 Tax=Thalassotalea sp. G20_0 TaxID=2821093 RepID=UPI001ADB19C1|nr:hypothetical protein [Thalassotalea sp. G20_0]MBO9494599.1 hypothetical protein [Thalassotalea sp. G20_0]
MKTFKTLALVVAVSAGLLSSAGVMAARQGTVGPTSNGDFEINYNVNPSVRIWGLEDMSFTGSLGSAVTDNFNFCTYSNNTDKVLIEVASTNTDFALNTTAVSGGPIPYTVTIVDKDVSTTTDTWGAGNLASGTQGSFQYSADKTVVGEDPNNVCIGTAYELNKLTVDIPAVSGVIADGVYSDIVTLTVTPI